VAEKLRRENESVSVAAPAASAWACCASLRVPPMNRMNAARWNLLALDAPFAGMVRGVAAR
jgi:hypothetical protein